MIKEFILKKGLGYAGKKLNGYKTKIGGAGFILMGLLHFVRFVFPDLTDFPEPDMDKGAFYITTGLGVLGIGHKMEKQTEATKVQTQVIATQNDLVVEQTKAIDEQTAIIDPTGVSPRAK